MGFSGPRRDTGWVHSAGRMACPRPPRLAGPGRPFLGDRLGSLEPNPIPPERAGPRASSPGSGSRANLPSQTRIAPTKGREEGEGPRQRLHLLGERRHVSFSPPSALLGVGFLRKGKVPKALSREPSVRSVPSDGDGHTDTYRRWCSGELGLRVARVSVPRSSLTCLVW